MSENDNCGWPTADDTACEHPPSEPDGRCWQHTDQGDQLTGGRPSKFDDCKDDLLEAATTPINHRQIANAGGIAKSTLYDWLNTYDEFSDEFKRARAQAADALVQRALDPADEVDRRFAQFLLERSFQFIKTERHEVGLDADHSFDATEGVTAEFVTYEPDSED